MLERSASTETATGILIAIMVDDAAATLDAIVANGGSVVQPIGSRLRDR